jgi:glycogen debranching enzyme
VPAITASLATLTRGQSSLGYVPIYVHPSGSRDQGDPGGIDNNLWYLLGHHALHLTFGASDLLDHHRDAITRAMLWARYQDSDDDGLIEAHEAADWADLMAGRGKVLYGNVLYVLALRAYADLGRTVELPDPVDHLGLAERAAQRLQALLWVDAPLGIIPSPPPSLDEHIETRRIVQMTGSELWSRPYFLPWVGFRDYGDWCDVLGNSLAILGGLADERQRRLILDYFDQVGVADPFPARSIHPSIRPGEVHWRPYYRNGNLNLPDQYQNGGCWPFIGGLFIAALVRDGRLSQAAYQLERLALALRGDTDDWAFNEWHHGLTGRPMGKPSQAWSAAMFLFAHQAVAQGRVPWPLVSAPHGDVDQSRLAPAEQPSIRLKEPDDP